MEFTSDQIVKVALAVIALVTTVCAAIFAVNKRTHKIGNIKGDKNKIINGDKVSKR
jgi:hypothetical protein